MTAVPNLDDPRVRQMADRNHQPEEQWAPANRVIISCGMCGQPWPCVTRKALDEIATSELPEWEAALLHEQARQATAEAKR